jgi:quercetin dioxygenase-like cupin family protein
MAGRVTSGDIAPLGSSPLALSVLRGKPGERIPLGDGEHDSLLYVFAGEGTLELTAEHPLTHGTAALVLAGEEATVVADQSGVSIVRATVDSSADRHAPLGPREAVARLESSEATNATGARSFQILCGPHNGSTRATLFAGFVPPGKAPWHYHLYDEIVWIPDGPGRLHLGEEVEELTAGSTFRLRPREVHIVENTSADQVLVVLGVLAPAGSPSAAYLSPDVAAGNRFSE